MSIWRGHYDTEKRGVLGVGVEASAFLATVGLGTTYYAMKKGQPTPMWATLGYLSLMELLQAFTYIYINQCNNPINQILTLLGYTHVAFQPFFINYLAMNFIDQGIARRIQFPVYVACFICAVAYFLNLLQLPWSGACLKTSAFCSDRLCSVFGNWHIGGKFLLMALLHILMILEILYI